MQAIDAVKQNPDLLSQVTPATKFGNVKQISQQTKTVVKDTKQIE